jgi:hypothetical protein
MLIPWTTVCEYIRQRILFFFIVGVRIIKGNAMHQHAEIPRVSLCPLTQAKGQGGDSDRNEILTRKKFGKAGRRDARQIP